ncbi:prephenate dehydratase [Bacillus benzoevorans]|uniref:Prephenate dehydratase n=1 Tax=Bacillus benzoevorans TaxID=1456 RepID=A0A7X0LVR6_9BACI|nr:prephenate dehydratase [Bacillus benzoevorans]
MKTGYLGPRATFTDLAVRALFPEGEAIPYTTIPDCIDAVVDDEIEVAVVPLENALEGTVNITLDYLIHEVDLPIRGEISAPIRQHFMVHPNQLENWRGRLTAVYSHSHAIAQCHKFLHQELKGIPKHTITSTAAAAQYVAENPDQAIGAIANELAAKEYGLVIAQPDVHDYNYNRTRFIVLSKKLVALPLDSPIYKGQKTTLMVTLPDDRSGALHQVLSAFAWRKLNLSKIESRPTKTGLGNYFFLIDIDTAIDEVLIPGAIAELEALDCHVNILGSYPYYQIQAK